MRERNRARRGSSAPWALLAVLAAMAFVAYVRLRYLDVPLERDEGEYAYAGRLILQGIPPYSIAYNMKFPGTYYAYALIMAVFGRTVSGIHLGLLLVNAASTWLVFAVGRRLAGELAGAVAAVSFAILSLDRWTFGVFAHATHFVVLAVLGGLIVLLRALDSERVPALVGSGVLFGLSVMLKQHAVFFLPFAAAIVVFDRAPMDALAEKAKRVGLVALGSIVPPLLVGLALWAQGVFGRFWFWTFHYAAAYVSEVPLSAAAGMFADGFKAVVQVNAAFWVLGALGFASLWTGSWSRRARVVLTGLFVASAAAICPGFYLREHYFILILPAISLLGGVAVVSLSRFLETKLSPGASRAAAVAVVAAAVGFYGIAERDYLFSWSPRTLSRTRFAANPFIEVPEIGKYIRERTNIDDTIAVMGSEPEIYFYADRKGATGYIYTYALLEQQPFAGAMQQEMIREIEAAHPKYLVFSWIDASWLATPESDQGIVSWGREYVKRCYDPVGVMDIHASDETNVVWDQGVNEYRGISPNLVYTFRRRSDGPCSVAP